MFSVVHPEPLQLQETGVGYTHKVRTYKEYHSVCPSSELGLSQPLSRQRVFPSPQKQGGGGILACGWGVGGSPNSDEGHTLWYSLYVRTLWVYQKKEKRHTYYMKVHGSFLSNSYSPGLVFLPMLQKAPQYLSFGQIQMTQSIALISFLQLPCRDQGLHSMSHSIALTSLS